MGESGRLVIRGRWFGVRGRRFVRPALILHGPGAPERRVLAELEDKPWAAEDGEAWQATFTLDSALGEAGTLELSVAPDIVVTLKSTPDPQRARTTGEPPARPAAAGRALEPQRLAVRLTSAESALERERERRVEAELALERQRTEAREQSAELGRLSAELALARAAEREARATADLLDVSRHDHHAAQTRYDALAAEHERTLRAQERLSAELGVRTEELTAAREALAGAPDQLTGARSDGAARLQRESVPAPHGGRVPAPGAEPSAGPASAPGTSHTDRPLNPSLRSHGWAVRLLAVLVLAAVVFAVYLILHSTVLH